MNKVLILDFGSQFTQLIARRIREAQVYCEICPFTLSFEQIQSDSDIKAIILSGGPNSVYEDNAPQIDARILKLGIPVLGICYGFQTISHVLGGVVEASKTREYGAAEVEILDTSSIFYGLEPLETVWMSHGDHVISLPKNLPQDLSQNSELQNPASFKTLAATDSCPIAAAGDENLKIYGIQFHPEVYHTKNGAKIIENFLFRIAKISPDWNSSHFIETKISQIRTQVGDQKVLCGLSGGVDSSVAAALIYKAIGEQIQCVFVDHGLLRAGEREEVESVFRDYFHIPLTVVDAADIFFSRLSGVTDPEQKRKIIGASFIEIFEKSQLYLGKNPEFIKFTTSGQALNIEGKELTQSAADFTFLAQGTLYPDVIESVSFNGGPSQTIKSHHNVGGLPKDMKFQLIEPLRELFKDEVRQIGRSLGLPEEIVNRHPFPGPGLGIRIIGEVTKEKLEILKKADKIFTDGLKQTINPETNKTLYQETWQAFAVLTEVKSVGVMGDGRTYENLLGLRAVTAVDGMTADWARLPYDFLAKISNQIINETKGVNRVVYDISSKPPATIEWE